jgi:hypothetical protein
LTEVIVDVVVEGKITDQEGVEEVLQSIADMNPSSGILRITCEDTGLQGRIGLAHGGYIVGAKVNVTNETGYEAVCKLLTVKHGNYAILDPGRQQSPELNQTLWMKVEKVIPKLRNLPATPQIFMEADPSVLRANIEKPSGQIDLYVPVERDTRLDSTKGTVGALKSKTRQHDQASWRFYMTSLLTVCALIAIAVFIHEYGNVLMKLLHR